MSVHNIVSWKNEKNMNNFLVEKFHKIKCFFCSATALDFILAKKIIFFTFISS